MNVIVAVDENYAIGYKNNLLARLPHDMKRFRALTSGNIVVMGRNTYFSLPSRPLPQRENIVLTSRPDLFPEKHDNLLLVSSVAELLNTAKKLEADDREIYVCGGSQVYKELLPYCKKALVTKALARFKADSWFPNLDSLPEWEKVNETETIETNGYKIKFTNYINNGAVNY